MAVHIFQVSEENYKICIKRGIVALPEPKEGRKYNEIFDALLSRVACIQDNDYILLYVGKGFHELRGVWQADGNAFYETTSIWNDKIYPFRCRIKECDYSFNNYLKLYEINDLINSGKIWTWAMARATGSNSMFSISDSEFNILLDEYIKINPYSSQKKYIPEPYPRKDSNIIQNVHIENEAPKYEYSIMTLLNNAFSNGEYRNIFGQYSDFLSYVPTNRGREMDIMLMYSHPNNTSTVMSYDIIEVKRDVFDEKALTQLIDYESWFLQKKVAGDLKMIRVTAIAKTISPDVLNYVNKRQVIENKPIKLLEYTYDSSNGLLLTQIN